MGTKLMGTKPMGTKPVGTEPVGTKPIGTESVSTEPVGTEPNGTKPIGTEPIGTIPIGTKPIGTPNNKPALIFPAKAPAETTPRRTSARGCSPSTACSSRPSLTSTDRRWGHTAAASTPRSFSTFFCATTDRIDTPLPYRPLQCYNVSLHYTTTKRTVHSTYVEYWFQAV